MEAMGIKVVVLPAVSSILHAAICLDNVITLARPSPKEDYAHDKGS